MLNRLEMLMTSDKLCKPSGGPRTIPCRMWSLACCLIVSAQGLSLAAHAGESTSAPSRPNVLLCIADDWSFGHAGVYGCSWVKTPGFDRVAREGLVFSRMYTPNAKCAPSRACLLTGRNSWQLKDACNHICYFPPEFKTYVEALRESGYLVGFTAKGWGPGVAKTQEDQARPLAGTPFNRRRAKSPTQGISNNDYAGNFVDFLDANPEGKPWCFWYGALEPHRGYEYGSGVRSGKKLSDVDRVPAYWPNNETIRNDMLDYALEVEHFDNHVERMLNELEQRDLLDQTIVIVTSDHGMPFPRCKGQAYEHSNHIPLAIMWPEGMRAPGRKIDDYVNMIDLAPTILEAAGLSWQDSGMQATPGRSLVEYFRVEQSGRVVPERDHVLIGKERHDIGRPEDVGYPIRGLIRDDKLLIVNYETSRWPAGNPETGYLNCDGSPTKTWILNAFRDESAPHFWDLCFGLRPSVEFYDLATDPDCVQNLADHDSQQRLIAQMRQEMERRLTEQADPRISGQGAYFDRIPYANASTRNFYQRYMAGERPRAGWVQPTDFEKEPLPSTRR